MTTPTVNETDSTNMPGVYELLLDEDTTVTTSKVEQMAFHVSATGWSGTVVYVELFDTSNYAVGIEDTPDVNVAEVNSIAVTGAGTEGDPWGP
jgi:hypothetical protein